MDTGKLASFLLNVCLYTFVFFSDTSRDNRCFYLSCSDLDQPKHQRSFQVFYLVLSTYFVGNALRGLVGLKEEIEQVHRVTAWGRREISSNLIEELQPDEHDGKVDQYEFLVASLVQLGKLSSEDIIPIMDKYRSLANDEGFIKAKDTKRTVEATDEEIEAALDEAKKNDCVFNVNSSPFR